MPRKKDTLFQSKGPVTPFEFNAPVVRVFDDMLARSVPFYKECLELTVEMVRRFARPKTRVYDLGCSTGTLLLNLARALPDSVRLTGLDNSPDMLKKARRRLAPHKDRCELVEADLMHALALEQAGAVVMNYTLQFVPPEQRTRTLKSIHRQLVPGGALILIEKVAGATPALDRLFIAEHHRFKEKHGYTKMEIARKRQALEKVLVPLTAGENEALLKKAGFREIDVFFRWANFCGWVAVKTGGSPRKT